MASCVSVATFALRNWAQARRKYFFSPELAEDLRKAYLNTTKQDISVALDVLQKRTGWPRHAFQWEARRQGWVTGNHYRPWSPQEIAYLHEKVGRFSLPHIAKKMGRPVTSVRSKADKLKLSRQAREGYNMADLQIVFGVGAKTVRRWLERGLLGKAHKNGLQVRVTQDNVIRFLKTHPSEYDLRRVDQEWYKGMVLNQP